MKLRFADIDLGKPHDPRIGAYFHKPQSEKGIETKFVNVGSKQWKGTGYKGPSQWVLLFKTQLYQVFS